MENRVVSYKDVIGVSQIGKSKFCFIVVADTDKGERKVLAIGSEDHLRNLWHNFHPLPTCI